MIQNKNFWRHRPVMVTGASGLVGSWLVRRLLQAEASVVCLLRDQVPASELCRSGLLQKVVTVRGDLADQALLERILGEYEVRTVFHLAAQTIVGIAVRNPVSTWESNIGGAWRLFEACRRSPLVSEVVFASSDKAYGAAEQLPYDENTPLRGVHPYDVSKSCADLIAHSYAMSWGTPIVITRCGNFFGGGDLNWSRIVPGTLRSLLSGESPLIRSDGTLIRDYFYVEDGAAAYMCLAEALAERRSLAGQAFNFSYQEPLTVLELVGRIQKRLKSDIPPTILGQASHEIPAQHLSAARAHQQLRWKPEFSIEEGLDRTIAWYRDFLGVSHG